MAQGGILERRVYAPGDIVFREGSEGSVAYIVQEGRIEIVKSGGEDGETVLGEIGKGGIFGEMALVDSQPRMATARAVTKVTVVMVPRVTFQDKLQKSDPFIRALLTIFVRNIRAMTKRAVHD